MLYCSKCDGNNEKSTRFCIHCGAEIVSKEEYYSRKDFYEAQRRSKSWARGLVFVLIEALIVAGLIGLMFILDSYSSLNGTIEMSAVLVGLASPFLVIPCINSISRKKYDSATASLTYLYGMGVDKSEILRPDIGTVATDKAPSTKTSDRGGTTTGKTTGFKGDLHGKKPIPAKVPKARIAHPIYKSAARAEAYWKCLSCDTENNTMERICVVCGMRK